MYAIYEDASAPSSNSPFGSSCDQKEEPLPTVMTPSTTAPTRDKENRAQPSVSLHVETKNEEISSEVLFGNSPRICQKMNKSGYNRHTDHLSLGETERKYSTLPYLRRHPKAKSEPSSNPLLDTISVLTYDPCDSDDYCDLTSVYEQRKGESDHEEKSKDSPHHHQHQGVADGDRDSVGYAGSSSIDSGYKSFCPTPEIPDSVIYGADRTASCASSISLYTESSNSSTSSQGRGNGNNKSKVPVGTKVGNRQSGLHVGTSRDLQLGAPGSRRSDSSLYDVNLDHLMYLRQSLLSAIQKCESSASREATSKLSLASDKNPASEAKCNRGKHATPQEPNEEVCSPNAGVCKRDSDSLSSSVPFHSSALTASAFASPTYQKTVRFNTDVKVTTVGSGKTSRTENCGDAATISHSKVTNDRGSSAHPNSKSFMSRKAKSILKDPLCANLRSQLESGNVDCTLEEEIDSLLYGRAEFYDLESVNEFPCSYVTMIEEKYRSCKPSVAKVRKLKGGQLMEGSKLIPTSENCSTSSYDDNRSSKGQKEFQQDGSVPPSLSSELSTTCRFTEVARCMLEIIEDLQLKKLSLETGGKRNVESSSPHSNPGRKPSAPCADGHNSENTRCTTSETYIPVSDLVSETQSGSTNASSSGYTSASEYHVYEEITYDFVGHSSDFRQPSTPLTDVPPPLPARPNALLQKLDNHQRISKSSCAAANMSPSQPHNRKDRTSRKQSSVSNDGSVRDRPKQRSNLYSLFSDQSERRNISRSLEREWIVASSDGNGEQDDEYGFRRNYPSD